jgi:hypothetical protein
MPRRFQFSLLQWLRQPPDCAAASRITLYSLVVCAASSVATVALIIYEGSPHEPGWFLSGVAFAVWGISPYLGLAALVLLTKVKTSAAGVTAVAITVSVVFAAWTMIDAFFVNVHSTSALVLIFVPLWQWAGVTTIVTVLGLTATVNWIRGRPQFSLRSLLMAMLYVALACGLLRFLLF